MLRTADWPILQNMETAQGHEVLTYAQAEFADEMHAWVGMHCTDDAVCMYREERNTTIRWIIDGGGHVLDYAAFGHEHRGLVAN